MLVQNIIVLSNKNLLFLSQMNAVRFTPVQTEAIRSGMNKGLTMVVGPPGTGKTDVCVQIIANL
jgi:intron-binding protein aquarius